MAILKVLRGASPRELDLVRELNAYRRVIERAQQQASRARRTTLRTMREGGAHGLRINHVRRMFDRIDDALKDDREG